MAKKSFAPSVASSLNWQNEGRPPLAHSFCGGGSAQCKGKSRPSLANSFSSLPLLRTPCERGPARCLQRQDATAAAARRGSCQCERSAHSSSSLPSHALSHLRFSNCSRQATREETERRPLLLSKVNSLVEIILAVSVPAFSQRLWQRCGERAKASDISIGNFQWKCCFSRARELAKIKDRGLTTCEALAKREATRGASKMKVSEHP